MSGAVFLLTSPQQRFILFPLTSGELIMKNFIIIFLCVFLNLSAAFALELDENDNNKVFEVAKGEKIAIRLDANATTG